MRDKSARKKVDGTTVRKRIAKEQRQLYWSGRFSFLQSASELWTKSSGVMARMQLVQAEIDFRIPVEDFAYEYPGTKCGRGREATLLLLLGQQLVRVLSKN